MPTELPVKKLSLTDSTSAGNLAFIVAVLLMLAISTVMLMQPESGDVAGDDAPVPARTF